MAWVAVAAAIYFLVGLGCYFYGFQLIKKLRESRFGKWGNRSAAARLQFEPPYSRPLVLFFRGFGIFLMVAGVVFFLVMMRLPRH
jgi:hypothetical protein